MSLYSLQDGFCNICGKAYKWSAGCSFVDGRGNPYFCSMVCTKEHQWRDTLSIMGREYYSMEKSGTENAIKR